MINKIKMLGENIYKHEGDKNPLNLKVNVFGAFIICADFVYSGDEIEYKGINTVEEYSENNMEDIMLADVPPGSTPPFPSWTITGKTSSALKKVIKSLSDKCNLEIFSKALEKKYDTIEEDINNAKNKEKTNILTIRINDEFIGSSPLFIEQIKEYKSIPFQSYYSKHNTISKGNNNKCYLCGKESEILFGFCSTFNFYSANEIAYIAGGFKQNQTWKNYPVCSKCAKHLRVGKEKILNSFNRYFYGNKYFLIPAPTMNWGNFYNFLLSIEEEFKDLSLKREQETNQQIRSELEEEIFDTLAHQNEQITFTFFFYAETNSEFKILQEAEDILPSRFQKIINAKRDVENYEEFKNLKGLYKKNELSDLKFNFGIIKTFFQSNFINDFLDITTKILKGQPINYQFILHHISERMAQSFRLEKSDTKKYLREKRQFDYLRAKLFLKLLYNLNLIKKTPGRSEVEMNNKYSDHFQLHPEFYDADWKKAVFLTGVLAQHVMDIQYRERGARPFRSRLNSLKLDAKAIKRLLPESIEKLEQYKSNYYRDLEESISIMMESGEPELKNQSVDEISFYFAMGMNMNKKFKTKEEKGE